MASQFDEPIAIVGSACRFAGSASSPSKLWELLRQPKDLQQEIPESRFRYQGFYHPDGSYHGHSNVKHAYFLEEDPGVFDAEFFGIRPVEAKALDPQQRVLLEVAYEAIESAGMSMPELRGSDTAVYAGSMGDDYAKMILEDIQDAPTYYATGAARSILSNRVSYSFDWHGPSISIDTACSSSLVAVHMALQTLRSGDSRMALACGTNLILGPENFIIESKLGMLSPDGRSRMWDQGANGYARGDGVAVLLLKTLKNALKDGDNIECIIRETGLNQDGATAGITMPSASAQTALIRKTYAKAGLDLLHPQDWPQFFEAHGTGTPAGDPIEAEAIHNVFGAADDDYKTEKPLYVGSIKTIFGHTEGTAGIAAVLKASLALQNKCIPPNLLFEQLSDRVSPFYKQVEIPRKALPWPDVAGGRRRASVNSFGFGGANAHAILESFDATEDRNDVQGPLFTLFVFSAHSESSLVNMLRDYSKFLNDDGKAIDINNFAWTLRERRSVLGWRTSVVASSPCDLATKLLTYVNDHESNAGVRALADTNNKLFGIFTGQGAQYMRMGAELIQSSEAARNIVQELESYLREIPDGDAPTWSLTEELMAEPISRINEAAISQPLCTAVQILLVDLLRLGGVRFHTVVGHSSGEIAAAYAAGFLSARDAMVISYYRGVHLRQASSPNGFDLKGAMLAVETSPEDAAELCADRVFKGRIVVAAANSPSSVTLSGDAEAISELEEILQDEGTFYRRLKVDRAYHSPHMLPCYDPYVASLRQYGVKPLTPEPNGCTWFSSVNNKAIDASTIGLGDIYWAENLTRPVLFSQAISAALVARPCDMVLEVGPHPALKSPARSTILDVLGKELPYHGTLMRGKTAVEAMSSALGYLWSYLGPSCVDLDGYERAMTGEKRRYRLVKGLPTYPWNHGTRYWHESRTSRKLRRQPVGVHPLLGHESADSASHHLSWKHLLRVKEMPWLTGHQVQGQIVFPAAGYICAAVEAARHMSETLAPGQGVQLIMLHEFVIHQAIVFNENDGVEAAISIANITSQLPYRVKAHFTYSAAVSPEQTEDLVLVASCDIEVQLGEANETLLSMRKSEPPHMIEVDHEHFYAALKDLGYEFSGRFRSLSSMRRKHARSSCFVQTGPLEEDDKALLIPPSELDACLQSIMLAYSYPYDGRLRNLHLPTTIGEIVFNPLALSTDSETQGSLFSIDGTVTSRKLAQRGIIGHSYVTRGSSQNIAIRIRDAVFIPLGNSGTDDRKIFSKANLILDKPDGLAAARGIPLTEENGVTIDLLERIAIFYLRKFDREIPEDHPARSQDPTDSYLTFARYTASVAEAGRHKWYQQGWLEDSLEDVIAASEPFYHCPDVQIMHLVGSKMPAVFAGEGTMLEYFRADDNDILDRYYVEALGLKQSADWLSRTVKQLTDRYRYMNVLEIGAGTGGATKAVFREIGSSFSSYTYTDISAAFFENASSTFSRYKDRMVFKTFNVENDPIEQGFSEGTYDLVVCFFILHATSDITRCLRNIRRLLKPGGFLIVGEGQNAWEGAATMGFIFGPLSGWWVGAKEGRVLSPYVPIQDWDKHLRAAGFSGVDTSPPKEFQESYSVFHFVSQAVDDYVSYLREPLQVSWEVPTIEKLVIIGGQTARTSNLVTSLQDIFTSQPFVTRCDSFLTLLDVDYELVDASSTVLCLTELDSPVFKNITADRFMALRTLFQSGKTLLWVTSGRLADEPFSQMTVGLSRVAANEAPDLRIQQLEIADLATTTPEYLAEALLRFHATGRKSDNVLWSVEPEIIIDASGHQLIPRLEQIPELNDRYNSDQKLISHEVDFQKLNIPVSLEYNNDSYIISRMPVEDTSALRTKYDGSLIKLRTQYSTISAVKTPIGNRFIILASCLETGAKYLTLVSTTVPSIFTAPKESLVTYSVHPGLSDADYLSKVSAHLIASEILGQRHSRQTIMVHNAPEIVARALASQVVEQGVKIVYTTDLSGGESGMPSIQLPQHITQSDVDEIFLPAKLSSFIGFSKADTQTSNNETILMKCLNGRCQSFSTAETLYSPTASESFPTLTDSEEDLIHSILETAQQTASANLEVCAAFPDVVCLDALVRGSRLEDSLGIVDWTSTALLPVTASRLDRVPRFKSNGTYWIVGISRALGISLVDWLISNGATNVVITSRDPDIDPGWISAHERKGVNVVVLPCDIMDEQKLQSVHAHICATLPPILGVIQGAMVLHDTLLRNMTFEQFREVMGPKVDGSIYLDRIFYDTDLDFFLLVSSINCVIGNVGQANYAAANTFMCGLAAHRRKRGLRSAAVNIGAIIGAGYVARQSRKEQDSIVERYLLQRLSEEDWCQAISEAIEACRRDSSHGPELTTGLTEVSLEAASAPNAPNWCSNPRFAAFVTAQETVVDEEQDEASMALGEQLRQCQSEQEAYHVIEGAFATQLRVVLQVSTSDQDLMASRGNEIGLDSLISVDIRSWFLKHLQVNVPVLKIMSNNTMASLIQFAIESLPPELLPGTEGQKEAPQNLEAQTVPNNTNGGSQVSQDHGNSLPILPAKSKTNGVQATNVTNGSPIDWNSETCPPADMADVIINTEVHPVCSPPHIIVLTGSTGLLGHHLLSHFLSFPSVEKIICLAIRSLALRLKQNTLPQDPRISYYEGDLADPLLGLTEQEAEVIFAEADVVVHNAADTSHLKHYVDVRAANVGSTVALTRLCLRRQIPFHYISSAGLGIYHEKSSTAGFPPGPVVVPPEKIPDGSFGYACSKFACERFLERMSEEYGMRIFIHRPSTIIREGEDAIGAIAEKDWINAFLVHVRKLRAVPTMERKDGALDLVNVSNVCGDISRQLFASDLKPGHGANVTYVHEVGDEVIPLDTLANLGLEDQGAPYDIVPRAEWMSRALSAGLHPGVAALIDDMAEGGEEYPKLLRGASSSSDQIG